MSFNKNSLSIRKRPAADSIVPVNGAKILSFHHQASGGETSISLSALVVPPSLIGFSNPALSDLLGAHLSVYPSSMQLVSSLNGILQKDVTWQMSGPQTIVLNSYTLTAGEIITGIIHATAANGVLVTDAYAVVSTGTLTAGQDTIVTSPFFVNKYSTTQVGDVLVFLNGVLQLRNVGNATAAPSADGNYQEVPVAGGLTNQVKLNNTVGSDTPYVVVSNGLVAERPTGSMLATVEVVQGQIDQLIPAVEALLGTPGVFGPSPSSVDLQSFGQTVLNLKYARSAKVCMSAAQSIPNITHTTIAFDQVVHTTHSGQWINGTGYNAGAGTWTTRPRFVAGRSGYYRASAKIRFGDSAGFNSGESCELTMVHPVDGRQWLDEKDVWSATGRVSLCGTTTFYLTAGQEVYFDIYQASGGAQNLSNIDTLPARRIYADIEFIGE